MGTAVKKTISLPPDLARDAEALARAGAPGRPPGDGRPGWAYYLISQGYVVYMVDYPARGRSAYVPGWDGNIGIRTSDQLEQIWTNVAARGDFPLKANHTQWPGAGKVGDPIFDTAQFCSETHWTFDLFTGRSSHELRRLGVPAVTG